jgi:hypothetical protein
MNNDDDFDLVDDFAWIRVLEIAEQLSRSTDPLHQDFARHLELVSAALRAINKVENGDHSKGGDVAAINDVLRLDDGQVSASPSDGRI